MKRQATEWEKDICNLYYVCLTKNSARICKNVLLIDKKDRQPNKKNEQNT